MNAKERFSKFLTSEVKNAEKICLQMQAAWFSECYEFDFSEKESFNTERYKVTKTVKLPKTNL